MDTVKETDTNLSYAFVENEFVFIVPKIGSEPPLPLGPPIQPPWPMLALDQDVKKFTKVNFLVHWVESALAGF